ncbi:DUF5994 family protein [Amycolatopsis sp. ATCC 39116]|uniref:DUF5994 family protein n=1 Tax=Amycolatopsis sp. (strain ATCC 39116 / 75iv2) TaxID=385957 RepID=UPI00026259EE|nr:DUF5994 family protein [Amycolatopsis sp. ATCC 39116]
MSSGPHVRTTTPKAGMAAGPPRLKLRASQNPSAPTPGYVDGAWWPRSRDLSAELPALRAVLAARLGPIDRIAYHATAWDPAVRHFDRRGSLAPVVGYRRQESDTVDVTTSAGDRLVLVVVPPARS